MSVMALVFPAVLHYEGNAIFDTAPLMEINWKCHVSTGAYNIGTHKHLGHEGSSAINTVLT